MSGELWSHLSASLLRLAIGWSVSTVFGIGMGLAVGLWSALRSPGMALVSQRCFHSEDRAGSAVYHLVRHRRGSKDYYVGVRRVLSNGDRNGRWHVDNVPRSLIRMGQDFGLSTGAIVRKIVLPGALPAILSGFRVTASIAIVLLVAAEMIGAERGIGAFVLSAGNLYDTDALMAGIVVLSVLGLVVAWVIGLLERALLAWR